METSDRPMVGGLSSRRPFVDMGARIPAELRDDNKQLAAALRDAHDLCEKHRDVATASLIEVWIDETERRVWFLFEAAERDTMVE
jgi:starvation-inducible DNA-binding protein